jgi:hypothetical protein
MLAEADDESRGLVEWAFVVEVVVEGWVTYMLARAEAHASNLVGEEYRLSAEALLALLFPCQYTAFLLRPVGPLLAF